MLIEQTVFSKISKRNLGFVISGAECTIDNVKESWGEPVLFFLIEEGAVNKKATVESLWESIQIVTTTKGRNDLVFTFHEIGIEDLDMSRMVILRLQMPDMSWIEDWKGNCRSDFY